MSKYLGTSLIIVALVIGTGLGYVLSPQYNLEESHSTDLGKADKNLDLRFIEKMIAHHEGAIYMAEQAVNKSQRSEIKELAVNIISAQQKEIDQMYEWKQSWYGNSQKIKKYEKVNLGEYDANFDLRFINAMISHHDDAIMMAKDVQTKSSRNEILILANQIITDQQNEIIQIQNYRAEWYGVKVENTMSSMKETYNQLQVDLEYINMMIAHHEGAVEMAKQIQNETERQELKDLSAAILEMEPKLIAELYEWKKKWYNDEKTIPAANVIQFGTYDETYDLRFLNALIAHHEEGVKMANEYKTKSTRSEILENASVVADFLTQSSEQLKAWRNEWYQVK